MTEIDVIVPCRGTNLALLEDCLLSIAKQTIKSNYYKVTLVLHMESEERKTEIASLLSNLDLHAQIVSLDTEASLNLARFAGVKNSENPYVFFLDSDDTISMDCLEILSREMAVSNFSPDFVTGRMAMMHESGLAIRELPYRHKRRRNELVVDHPELIDNFSMCNVLFSRESLTGCFSIDELPHEDIAQFCRAIDQSTLFSSVPSVTYYYRITTGSIVRSNYGRDHTYGIAQGLTHLSQLASKRGTSWLDTADRQGKNLVRTLLSRIFHNGNIELLEAVAILSEQATKGLFCNLPETEQIIIELGKSEFQEEVLWLTSKAGMNLQAPNNYALEDEVTASPLFTKLEGQDVILTFADYHLDIALSLLNESKAMILDLSHALASGARASMVNSERIIRLSSKDLPLGQYDLLSASSIHLFNDTQPSVRDALEARSRMGLRSHGIIERVIDADRQLSALESPSYPWVKNSMPYRRVSHVLCAFDFQLEHFNDRFAISLGDPVTIEALKNSSRTKNDRKNLAINLNFSYGINVQSSNEFLSESMQAALSLGYNPVITRHPMDETDISGYEQFISKNSYLDVLFDCAVLVTRFSGLVPLALALRKSLILLDPLDGSGPMKHAEGVMLRALQPTDIMPRLRQIAQGWEPDPECVSEYLSPSSKMSVEECARVFAEVVEEANLHDEKKVGQIREHVKIVSRAKISLKSQTRNYSENLYAFLVRRPKLHKLAKKLKSALEGLRKK